MLVSYNWLNKYFENKLPSPAVVADSLTFHSWEIDEMIEKGNDVIFDVKILPDKSMWALSHRGIAKDLSVVLNLPLAHDPLVEKPNLTPTTEIGIKIESDSCRRIALARIKGVQVKPSPKWLSDALEAIGQRSINNIVDASNFVMFDLGQPSHCFDAKEVGTDGFTIRPALASETLLGLDEIEYKFTPDDVVITRADTDEILSIAGLKGGRHSGIADDTTDIIIEVANWDPISIRKTGQRLKLRTDASARYENGITPAMVTYGLSEVVKLILEVAGGELQGYTDIINIPETDLKPVAVSLVKINSVLGLGLTEKAVSDIFNRFLFEYQVSDGDFVITPPFWRTDLFIPEDIIEEVGRMYGYEQIEAITPPVVPLTEINKRFYYTELVREALTKLGWSEVYTSSFRSNDIVKMENAFASDKGYLRSTLRKNITEALQKNAPNADLLGVQQIKIFEIGTIFAEKSESYVLTLGIQSPSGYKQKVDNLALNEALESLNNLLSIRIIYDTNDGVVEIDFDDIISSLPNIGSYQPTDPSREVAYKPFSPYPSISRDIAMWVDKDITAEEIENVLKNISGELCAQTTLFDTFTKDERTSYAFRLVFQSNERTLTGEEIDKVMETVYEEVKNKNWEVR